MEPKETLPAPRSDGWVQLGLLLLVMPLSQCVMQILMQEVRPTLHELVHAGTADPARAELHAIALSMAIPLAAEAVLLLVALAWCRGSIWARPAMRHTRRQRALLFLDGVRVGVPAALAYSFFLWWTEVLPGDSRYEGYLVQPSPYFLPAKLLVTGVMAVLCEEIYFRRALYSASRLLMPRVWACVANAALFSARHTHAYDNPVHMAATAPMGALLCYQYGRSSSIIPGATCHAITNMTVVLLTQAI